VLENVVIDQETRQPDFSNKSLTENSRLAYPLTAIAGSSQSGKASTPKAIIMLTADAFGVLPPIAKLTEDQAMYHFMSGYTAKVAGTERGITEPVATFSACFGAPFLPLHPTVYADMLAERMRQHKVPCYLVNTGWTGGAYGTGKRFPLAVTRALINAALSGALDTVEMRRDENFGFAVPLAVAGIEAKLLNPRSCWTDAKAYDAAADRLVELFADNFKKFEVQQRMAAE
jgi:phosphoenolpyruvate carboxykinase (ATP)